MRLRKNSACEFVREKKETSQMLEEDMRSRKFLSAPFKNYGNYYSV